MSEYENKYDRRLLEEHRKVIAERDRLREALEEACYLMGMKDLDGNWCLDPFDIDEATPGQKRIAQALLAKELRDGDA